MSRDEKPVVEKRRKRRCPMISAQVKPPHGARAQSDCLTERGIKRDRWIQNVISSFKRPVHGCHRLLLGHHPRCSRCHPRSVPSGARGHVRWQRWGRRPPRVCERLVDHDQRGGRVGLLAHSLFEVLLCVRHRVLDKTGTLKARHSKLPRYKICNGANVLGSQVSLITSSLLCRALNPTSNVLRASSFRPRPLHR